jgi:hypothetical protein
VFTFASTCLVLFVDGCPSLFIYIHGFLTIKDKKEHFVRDFVWLCVFVFLGTR